jgi:hypothetical protein
METGIGYFASHLTGGLDLQKNKEGPYLLTWFIFTLSPRLGRGWGEGVTSILFQKTNKK